eukprot:NODE_3730_length_927_cov_17.552392_g3430_i0.p1 GENE.NODE_3730_length_927_cov_17.552392_g3430_i0~~NODE_3730_length_927_cov_17.552392_g3430_i0.p1  ORF type:complete len:206 (-),score=35.22 NODE_3730_length_927_cov_17.552392_g3430_i0:240-857(-)
MVNCQRCGTVWYYEGHTSAACQNAELERLRLRFDREKGSRSPPLHLKVLRKKPVGPMAALAVLESLQQTKGQCLSESGCIPKLESSPKPTEVITPPHSSFLPPNARNTSSDCATNSNFNFILHHSDSSRMPGSKNVRLSRKALSSEPSSKRQRQGDHFGFRTPTSGGEEDSLFSQVVVYDRNEDDATDLLFLGDGSDLAPSPELV